MKVVWLRNMWEPDDCENGEGESLMSYYNYETRDFPLCCERHVSFGSRRRESPFYWEEAFLAGPDFPYWSMSISFNWKVLKIFLYAVFSTWNKLNHSLHAYNYNIFKNEKVRLRIPSNPFLLLIYTHQK